MTLRFYPVGLDYSMSHLVDGALIIGYGPN